jgi:uncharacterized protein YlxW (UPF0749 family)
MSKDFDQISKQILKNNKEIHDMDNKISKDLDALSKDVNLLKKDIKTLSNKIDSVLDILNTLAIFIEDAEHIIDSEDSEEDYQSNEGWLPEVNNWEENRDDDDEDI